MSFDYTFDYIVAPIGSVEVSAVASALKLKAASLASLLLKAGYTIANRNGIAFVEDWPVGAPSILEIMTSSTSGGNKKRRSGISHAFEDALLRKSHRSPGINYRQVWARMVSQLIVKSEIALEWGGKAVWLVQDVLVEYIRASTALDMSKFMSAHPSEVNMLSFSYGEAFNEFNGVIELSKPTLYAGPMTAPGNINAPSPSFSDMIRAPSRPSAVMLHRRLLRRSAANHVIAP